MKSKQLASSFSNTTSICAVCSESLSRIGMFKKVCSACHQAVCDRCSKQKIYDSNLQKKVRICDLCFSKRVEVNIRASFEKQLSINSLEQEMLKEQLKEEQDKAHTAIIHKHQAQENYHLTIEKDRAEELKLLSQIEELEESNQEKEHEYNLLKEQVKEIQQQNGKYDLETEKIEEEIVKLRDFKKKDSSKVTQLRNLIEQQRIENEKISEQIILASEPMEWDLEDLRIQVRNLENTLKGVQKENKNLNTEIAQIKNNGVNSELCNNPVIIKRLEDILAQQQSEIDELQKELEDSKSGIKTKQTPY